MENIIIIIVIYILNVFLNRRIYFKLQKIDPDFYPNPPAVFACFLSIIGTFALLCIVLMNSKIDFFKYK